MNRSYLDVPPPNRKVTFGINYRRVAKWFLLLTLVGLGWLLWPAAGCSFRAIDETPLGRVEEEGNEVWDSDTERVIEAANVPKNLVGKIGYCYTLNPISAQLEWKQYTTAGLGALTLLFWFVSKTQKRNAY